MTAGSLPSRRTVLRSAGTAGAAALTAASLAACGGPDDAATGASTGASTGAATGPLAKVSDVPVGGGVILPGEKLVVTQPTAGDFKAFSAVCTHQGCVVAEVSDGAIICRCHGSRFAIATGEPTEGPARKPLSPTAVSVKDGTVVRA